MNLTIISLKLIKMRLSLMFGGILKDKFKNESEKKYEYLGVGFHG